MIKRTIQALGSLASIFLIACAMAPAGAGSKDETGKVRDPSQILKVGDTAPDFQVPDHNGNTVKLADFRGKKNVVLIFYPADDTPGCTKQLCAARDDKEQYEKHDAVVFGVNPGTQDSHKKFADKFVLPFPLLADTTGKMVRDYGCRTPLGLTDRTVYVIDKKGKIAFAVRGMPVTETILRSIGG